MTIALVQEADAASASVTLGSAATATNTVVVAVACLGATAATGVTGVTLGGSADNWALVTPGPSAQDTTSPNSYLNVSVWADPNCAGGSTAVAVTGTGVVATWAWEFSGLGSTDIAQILPPVNTYQDSWVASTAQTTVPAEAWLAIIAAANQTGAETITPAPGNGWTMQTAYAGTSAPYNWGAAAGYQTATTTGTPVFSGSFSQPSFSVTAIVTFGMALPAAPPPPVAVAASIAPGLAVTGGNLIAGGALNVTGGVNTGSGTASGTGAVAQSTAPVGLTPTPVKYGGYIAKPGDFVIVSTGNSPVTITFPAGAPTGSLVGVKLIASTGSTSAGAVVKTSGADVFDAQPPGTTTVDLTTTGATFIAQYRAAAATWYIQSAGYASPGIPAGAVAGIGSVPGTPAASAALPADLSLVAWSYDPAFINSPFAGTALTSGKIYLVMCPVRSAANAVNITTWITSAGAGLTANQNFAGVYPAAGTKLLDSGDVTAAFGSTGAFTGTAGASAALTPPYVWAAFLANGTTPPSLVRTISQAGFLANGNLPSTAPRFGTLSGTYTSLPATFGAAVPTTAAAGYFAALY